MKLKKEVVDKINKAFEELHNAGFDVGVPEIHVYNEAIRQFGSATPKHIKTDVSATITIGLSEKDLEVEK